MMRFVFAAATLVAASAFSCAARSPNGARIPAPCDHLEPLASPVTDPSYRELPSYDSALAETLFQHIAQGAPDAGALIMVMLRDVPPEPQEAVYVLAQESALRRPGQYRVVHARAKTRVPATGPAGDALFSEALLDSTVVGPLERVWTAMTGASQWRKRDDVLPSTASLGDPPARFVFDYWGNHVFSQGVAHSPGAGSCSASLAAVGELLIDFVHAADEAGRGVAEQRILEDVRKLSRRMNITPHGACSGSPCQTP